MELQQNDEQSKQILEQLFRQHYQELCFYAFKYVREFATAEDIVQDVFVKLLAQKSRPAMDHPKYYLYTSVRNASLNRLKKNKPNLPIEETERIAPEAISIEEEMIESEQKLKLYKAIDRLPEQCKKIFLASNMNDLKYKEVAENLDLSINTVKTQMKKAYRILRDVLKDFYLLF